MIRSPTSRNSSTGERPGLAAGIRKRIATVAIVLAWTAVVLFLAAGRLRWTWAWLYLGIGLATMLVNGAFLLRTHPETVAERGELRLERTWDKAVSAVYALAQFLAIPLVAGLDERFGWTGEPGLGWHLAGVAGLTAAYGLAASGSGSSALETDLESDYTPPDIGPKFSECLRS